MSRRTSEPATRGLMAVKYFTDTLLSLRERHDDCLYNKERIEEEHRKPYRCGERCSDCIEADSLNGQALEIEDEIAEEITYFYNEGRDTWLS